MTTDAPALSVKGVSKRYGVLQALDNVSIDFAPGTIHAVLGENGAGKSTFVGIVSGFVRPDSGKVVVGDRTLDRNDPILARSLGVELVHQHFMLVPNFSTAENLALSRLGNLRGSLHTEDLTAAAFVQARELGWDLEPSARTGNLPVGVQQRIELIKAISAEPKALLLDEPTAVLSPDEVTGLFDVLRRLRDQGRVIVLIAHKLAEVLAIADQVSVLRKGKLVAEAHRSEVDETILAQWMVGELPAKLNTTTPTEGDAIVKATQVFLKGDRGEPAVNGVSFDIRSGEILGFGGVDGNGQVELAEALVGIRRLASGQLESPIDETAYIPQDRQRDGLALEMSVTDNLLLSGQYRDALRSGPFFRRGAIQAWSQKLVNRFEVKTASLSAPVMSLSGGNQQKVVVARNLDRPPKLLVAVNPTRGLDVRATDFVRRAIVEAAAAGTSVALFSTDLDELALLAHRTVFLSSGKLVSSIGSSR